MPPPYMGKKQHQKSLIKKTTQKNLIRNKNIYGKKITVKKPVPVWKKRSYTAKKVSEKKTWKKKLFPKQTLPHRKSYTAKKYI